MAQRAFLHGRWWPGYLPLFASSSSYQLPAGKLRWSGAQRTQILLILVVNNARVGRQNTTRPVIPSSRYHVSLQYSDHRERYGNLRGTESCACTSPAGRLFATGLAEEALPALLAPPVHLPHISFEVSNRYSLTQYESFVQIFKRPAGPLLTTIMGSTNHTIATVSDASRKPTGRPIRTHV